MSTRYYTQKLIIAGDVVEHYTYGKPVEQGKKINRPGRSVSADAKAKEDNRGKVLQRARAKLRRTILSNVYQYHDDKGQPYKPVFLTLTFKENVEDLPSANVVYGDFLKRLNYHVYGERCSRLAYSVVPEFQRRGAVHYHVIFYNLPYIDAAKLAQVWGQGFIKVNAIDHVDNLGAYVCKYMVKDSADDRLTGRKCFWGSRGLYEPAVINGTEEELAEVMQFLAGQHEAVYTCEHENEYLGTVTYTQYRRKPALTLSARSGGNESTRHPRWRKSRRRMPARPA